MAVKKNTATKWVVFAFDLTDNTAKTGDAANITANIRIDGGVANAVDDTNPTELEDGYYIFDITAAEANGDHLVLCPASTTSNIQVIAVPGAVWTVDYDASDIYTLFDTANTELATSPDTTGTLRQMIQWMFTYFRNKKTMTATTETVYKEDASTALGTASVSDNGTTFTKGEHSSS